MGIHQALMGGTYVDRIVLTDTSLTASGFPVQVVQYRLNTNGIVQTNIGAGFTDFETWIQAAVNSNLYESRVTELSGSLTSGSVGVWENLGTTRTWILSQVVTGISICTIRVEIRQASTGIVLDSADIVLQAERL